MVWFRVRCLLLFMEALDKHLYNAYEGGAYAANPTSKVSVREVHFLVYLILTKRGCRTLQKYVGLV